ncbi:MAG: 50S ribosomal protein L1 [Fibrobacterales bacterium]
MKRGKNYKSHVDGFDKAKEYTILEACDILKKTKIKFDQTVEIHMNLGIDPRHSDQVVRGNVSLPNGTGKDVRVVVFAKGELEAQAKEAGAAFVGAEELAQKIQEGWLDFDVVVATPDMMGQVGRLARILGPRGLMPSPKSGTVTKDVSTTVKELKAGKISYRVDKGANIHAPVGKVSFTSDQLQENISTVIESVKKAKPQSSKGQFIKSLVITATMTPSVKLDMGLTR